MKRESNVREGPRDEAAAQLQVIKTTEYRLQTKAIGN